MIGSNFESDKRATTERTNCDHPSNTRYGDLGYYQAIGTPIMSSQFRRTYVVLGWGTPRKTQHKLEIRWCYEAIRRILVCVRKFKVLSPVVGSEGKISL